MELSLTLGLPRDSVSVPVARRVLRSALVALGIEDEVTSDIELALTEACTNVLDHAEEADEYEVSVGIDGLVCVIEVLDRGSGFDDAITGLGEADTDAEEGRGVRIIRDLTDSVEFTRTASAGNVVRMEKKLVLAAGSPLAALEGTG